MPEKLVYSAIDQVVECGASQVLLFINGDPFTDPRIFDFADYLAQKHPTIELGWFTNGALMTEAKVARLIKAGNIKLFHVSMQGGTKEVYEAEMGLDWNTVVANTQMLFRLNEEAGRPMTIRMCMCNYSKTTATIDQFIKMWTPYGASFCIGAYSNFGGLSTDEFGCAPWLDKPRLVCDRALNHTYIYWNGDVGQCCFDLMNSIVFGNLQTERLSTILASAKHAAMRRAHRELDVPAMPKVCHECNACKFHG